MTAFTKPRKGPTRPDRAMESALEANRAKLASRGLDPDNLPWVIFKGELICPVTGKLYAQCNPDPFESYFDRWHHKRTGE